MTLVPLTRRGDCASAAGSEFAHACHPDRGRVVPRCVTLCQCDSWVCRESHDATHAPFDPQAAGEKQGLRCTGSLQTAGPHPGRRPTGAFRRPRPQCFASRRGSGNTPLPSLLAATGSCARVVPADRTRDAPGAVSLVAVALLWREPLGSGTPAQRNPRQRRQMATARVLPVPNCQYPLNDQPLTGAMVGFGFIPGPGGSVSTTPPLRSQRRVHTAGPTWLG